MAHSVSKNCLKVMWLMAGLLCILAALVPIAAAAAPGSARITQPQNGFYINRDTRNAYPIRGQADAGHKVQIFANGVHIKTVIADQNGIFTSQIDFSTFIEGPVTLLAFKDGIRSIPISGTYDATPPSVTSSAITNRIITIVFNEANLENVAHEPNFRFSPSLNFRTIGGDDDISHIDEVTFQLSMRSIPRNEIINLSLSNIADAAGNRIAMMPVALNDRDGDRMADHWELQHGLDPLTAGASSDADDDGFANFQEYLAGSDPIRFQSAPIEIRDTIPQDDAGITNFARVPDQTAFAVLIRAVDGINLDNPAAVRFRIDDGYHQPYWRDLAHDAMRVIKLDEAPDEQTIYFWVAYDRFLESFMPTAYLPDALIQVSVAIQDIRNNILQPPPFEFKIESSAQKMAAGQNLPSTVETIEEGPLNSEGIDTGLAVVDGKLAGTKLFYSSLEPLTPEFGNPDEMPSNDHQDMQPAGWPVNLLPHTVFDQPVTIFIPVNDDVDIRKVGLAYFDGTRWLPAADADGDILPGGEGWMVPDSRINHEDTIPPMIEVKVHHFSAAQTVVFAKFGDPIEKDTTTSRGSNANVAINCFINSVSADASFDFTALIALIAVVCFLLLRRFSSSVFQTTFR